MVMDDARSSNRCGLLRTAMRTRARKADKNSDSSSIEKLVTHRQIHFQCLQNKCSPAKGKGNQLARSGKNPKAGGLGKVEALPALQPRSCGGSHVRQYGHYLRYSG